jgi:hypothetical protein
VHALTTESPAGADAVVLIEEARRRQRRRWWVVAAGAAASVVAAGTLTLAVSGGRPPGRGGPPTDPGRAGGAGAADTRLLMWPAGPAVFGSNGGPPAYVDDLTSGRLTTRTVPAIAGGDFQWPLVQVGAWLVYNGDGGVTAVRASLRGRPRVVGAGATYFTPSASGGQVWLVTDAVAADPAGAQGRVTVQPVTIWSGRRGVTRRLPVGVDGVVEGTAAGLLVTTDGGDLGLWRPGAPLRRLARLDDAAAFAANVDWVAYGTDCANLTATSGFAQTPVGYTTCSRLVAVDLLTGRRLVVAAPAGTIGWLPNWFALGGAISAADRLLDAQAVVAPASKGRARLFLLGLTGGNPVLPVPDSYAPLYARAAWSTDGSSLFYQGSNGRLRSYQPQTRLSRGYQTRCCQYGAMFSISGG